MIELPSGVTVDVQADAVVVKGSKGELSQAISDRFTFEVRDEDGKQVLEVGVKDLETDRPMWGTMRAILANMVKGVSEGWSKSLELNGVGFRMDVKGSKLNMRLGFSHEIDYDLPEGIEATIENNILTISGIDRQKVGQVAAEIRAFKKPEPYKGKGFRYTDEVIRRKVGKAAKTE